MGEARKRGTLEQRKAAAQEKKTEARTTEMAARANQKNGEDVIRVKPSTLRTSLGIALALSALGMR